MVLTSFLYSLAFIFWNLCHVKFWMSIWNCTSFGSYSPCVFQEVVSVCGPSFLPLGELIMTWCMSLFTSTVSTYGHRPLTFCKPFCCLGALSPLKVNGKGYGFYTTVPVIFLPHLDQVCPHVGHFPWVIWAHPHFPHLWLWWLPINSMYWCKHVWFAAATTIDFLVKMHWLLCTFAL